jgi:acyl carrier protein
VKEHISLEAVESTVVGVIAEVNGCDAELISLDEDMYHDLFMDEHDQDALLFALEDEFDVSVSDDAIVACRTVRDVAELVIKLLEGGAS